MQKCQIVKNHRRFGHSPSSVWKPLSSRDCSFENNGTKRAGKLDARAVSMKWKTLFRPSGCIVPSLKMISISNCFRLKVAPEHLLRPLTAMSDRLWPGELKCSATGKPPVFFWILRRCSPNRSCRVRPVSPMYSWGHRRHEMQYTTFSDLQVKCSRIVVALLGPHIYMDVGRCV